MSTPLPDIPALTFDNSFFRLGQPFYTEVVPQGFAKPHMVSTNPDAARLLGLEAEQLHHPWLLEWASGNGKLPGSQPLAMVYSGHQFGGYSPQLGDGRGLLLGEIKGPQGKWDIHLKGAGKTPYSRFGDGRAVLRSTIREYLGSEALYGLGIPTTRGLCIVGSDEPVQRETLERGAMLIRLARTHVRFGSFEYFHHTGQPEAVKKLADHVIEQHLPELAENPSRYTELFRRAVHSTAETIAQWQAVGFAHGVMNTDNMSILGDTLDYGPYGFLDSYQPGFICNHSDTGGRYAFNRQPMIGLWNCNMLGNAITSLVSVEELTDVLKEYEPHYLEQQLARFRSKLGLTDIADEEITTGDKALIADLLQLMADNQVDYTRLFRHLCNFNEQEKHSPLRDMFLDREGFDHWTNRYRKRLQQEQRDTALRQQAMKQVNPKYILRNYLAEIAIRKAEDEQDYGEIERLLTVLANPFDEQPAYEQYASLPPEWAGALSISCSS
jgi:uncharacterized protein YdiU (UPF0061 family)